VLLLFGDDGVVAYVGLTLCVAVGWVGVVVVVTVVTLIVAGGNVSVVDTVACGCVFVVVFVFVVGVVVVCVVVVCVIVIVGDVGLCWCC